MARVYHRNGPSYRHGNLDFIDIRRHFSFRSLQVGHWVSPAERIQAANLIYDALCDLQSILAVPAEVISLRGQLSLAYGTGGQMGVQAHYEPGRRLLALAKNAGGGALAHEWFHAFDHYIASKMFLQPKHAFASHAWLLDSRLKPHSLNRKLSALFAAMFLVPDSASGEMSKLFIHSRNIDKACKQLYFARPEELAARCFEAYIQSHSLKNSFLVSGTLRGEMAKLGVYPDAPMRTMLSHLFSNYFSHLGVALRA